MVAGRGEGSPVPPAAGAVFGAEQGARGGHVRSGSGPVDDAVVYPVRLGADRERQVAAVLDLVDGIATAGPAALLLARDGARNSGKRCRSSGHRPGSGVAQVPCGRVLRQGVCDLSQARRIGDRGEAVAFLDKRCPRRLCGAGDVLVPA